MIQATCWVLIHSLWQGVLLALAGGGVILVTKRSAAVRYRLLCGLFGLFLVGMGLTFFYEWTMASNSANGGSGAEVAMNWFGEWCSVHAFQVVAVWLVVAALKSVRMAAGWSYIRRMRREGLGAPALWVEKVDGLARQLGIRRSVKLVESTLIRVPMVIGQLKPIIYVPLGLINHLPAGEMEAVLLHELAHIRRYDHVVNMLQQVVECLLFFNPGFLWISSLLREERENCCDDMAIALMRDRVELVRALVRFKEHSMRGMGLAFPGNKRQLLHRVLRISKQENKTLSGRERFILLGGCVMLVFLLAARVGQVEKRVVAVEKARVLQVDEVRQVAPVQPELVAVLRTQQQVAQNMEWVQAQLDQIRHKSNVDQVGRNREQVERNREQVERNREQVERNRAQAVRNREQMERNRVQVQQNREQAARDRAQQELNLQQAIRDRGEADRQRVQAAQQLVQAAQQREQAERDRQQADRDRQQAERDRQQADRDRQQAERDRMQAEKDRQQAEKDRTSRNN